MDEVFRGLAGLLRGIYPGQSLREIPKSSPASLRKTLSFPTLLIRIYILFQISFSSFKNRNKIQSRNSFSRLIKATLNANILVRDNFMVVKLL